MNIQPDFEEFLGLLEKHQVDYMIVGGYAVAFHGHPRFTKDIDIFFAVDKNNISKIRNVLIEFGYGEDNLNDELFINERNVITLGVEPNRIDLINNIDGLTFDEARANAVKGKYGKFEVVFIGLKDLIRNKQSTKRTKDKADAEELT